MLTEMIILFLAGETALSPYGPTSLCHLDNGRYYADGDTWQLDDCTLCICHQGTPLCIVDSCPPTLCRHPVLIPKTCCPVCPGIMPYAVIVLRSHLSLAWCSFVTLQRQYGALMTYSGDSCTRCRVHPCHHSDEVGRLFVVVVFHQ